MSGLIPSPSVQSPAAWFRNAPRGAFGGKLFPPTQAEQDTAVVIADQAIPHHEAIGYLNLRRYGGAPGAGDNSAAMSSAEAVAAEIGGGVILLDTAGEWRMNWVCTTDAVIVRGGCGRAEFDLHCVRPFDLASPAITFGDGLVELRYSGLDNVHMSGTDDVGGANYADETRSAPACLKVYGALTLIFQNCAFYNGLHTIHLEPSAAVPITGLMFVNCLMRNDLDAAGTRCIWTKRIADPGYLTNVHFIGCKFNSHAEYWCEIDGSAVGGAVLHFNSGYADCPPGKGLLLKGGALIRANQFDIDPGATGVVIVETDNAQDDPAKYIFGNLTHGGQKIKFAGGVEVLMPSQNFDFHYNARLFAPFLGPTQYVSTVADPYNTSVNWELSGATGPLALNGANLRAGKRIDVMGSNASLSATIDSVGAGGGLRIDAAGTDQNVQLHPTGTGQVVLGGDYTRPTGDNTQDLGGSGNRWKVVRAGTGSINTSDERHKEQISDIPDAWLRAWARVQWQRFKFKDAVAEKGDGSRWHVGLIAQRVIAEFAAEGLDAMQLGIVCYDEWPDQFEDQGRVVNKKITDASGTERTVQVRKPGGKLKLVKPSGNIYSLRYDEALALECALLRSRLDAINA